MALGDRNDMTSRVGSLGGLTKSISVATLISLFLLANPGIALAVDKPGLCDTVTAQLDNDEMGGTDRNYTGAFRMACVTSPPRFLDGLMPPAPDTGAKTAKRLAYALGTSVYTPDDLSRSDLIEDDQPYAGWLYLGFALERDVVPSSGPRYLDNLELQLGVVGPYSGAEHLQSLSHEVFGATDPQGWGNQLDNEPGVNLFYSRQWTGAEVVWVGDQNGDEGLLVDVTPELGLGLGNIHIFGAAGLSFRFGDFLPDDHGPNTLRPSLPGSDSFPRKEGFSAYLFGGVEGRVVARNIFLDGNTFQDDGPSVDKNILVGEARLGLAMTYDNLRFAYTQVFRSQEFDGQSGQVYGSFTLSIAL